MNTMQKIVLRELLFDFEIAQRNIKNLELRLRDFIESEEKSEVINKKQKESSQEKELESLLDEAYPLIQAARYEDINNSKN